MVTHTHKENPDSLDGIDLAECRRLLGALADGKDDAAIGQIRRALYEFAWCAQDLFALDSNSATEQRLLAKLPADQREEVEERAAMLQFDAKMTRSRATRGALGLSLGPDCAQTGISRISRTAPRAGK
jgi:hypothetical protein